MSSQPAAGGVVFLGGGAMGEALLAGTLAAGTSPSDVLVLEANPATAEALRHRYPVSIVERTTHLPAGSLIVCAVKPQQVADALTGLRDLWPDGDPGCALLSIAAGISRAHLTALVPPGVAVLRAMPNTPALIGKGMTGLVHSPDVPGWAHAAARRLLAGVGAVAEVDEAQIDALTVISGSGPAYLFYLAEAMMAGGTELGLTPALARTLTIETLLGAAALLADSPHEAGVLRQRVTSPGGVTQAVIETFDAGGLPEVIRQGLQRGHQRSRALDG